MTKRILFSLAVVVLFFAVLEGGLRLAGVARPLPEGGLVIRKAPSATEPDVGTEADPGEQEVTWTLKDPDLLWRLKPDHAWSAAGAPASTNSLGLRGAASPETAPGAVAPPVAAPAGPAVLCMGDSCTFGLGVRDAEAYPAQLAGLLAERASEAGFRCWNAGVPGYSSAQILFAYERDRGALPHRYLVVGAGFADRARRFYPDRQRVEAGHRPVYRIRTALYGLRLTRSLDALLKSLRGQGEEKRAKPAASVQRVAVEEYLDNLGRLRAAAEQRGARLIVMDQATQHEPAMEHHRRLPEWAAAAGVPFVPVRERFAALGFPRPHGELVEHGRLYFHDPIHPSAAGYRVVAEAVADVILRLEAESAAARPGLPSM